MTWLHPILASPPQSYEQRMEKRALLRKKAGEHLRKFGPPGSKAYNREAKRLWRERGRI